MKKTLLLIMLLSPLFLIWCISNKNSKEGNIEVDNSKEAIDFEESDEYFEKFDEYFETWYSDEVIDSDTAKKYVSESNNVLSLDNLTNLDIDSARELAKFEWETLSLQWLKTIDINVLKELEVYSWYLVLWLDKLDIDFANELKNFKWNSLWLSNIRRADLDAAVLSTINLYNFKVIAIEDFEEINREVEKILSEEWYF